MLLPRVEHKAPPRSRPRAEPLPKSARVLLLVDFINPLDFPSAKDIASAAVEAARITATLKRRLARQGVAVVYANDNYGVWRSDFDDGLADCLQREGEAGELARLLVPAEADLRILKPRNSAFHATPLALLLQRMETKELVIAGLATDLCVLHTAMDAHQHGFSLRVPADCTAAESPEGKRAALDTMRRHLGADTRPAAAQAPTGDPRHAVC